MVYSAYGIPGVEASAAQNILAALISYKLNWEYLEMCGFVMARMSLGIVRYNSLLLQGPRDKGARIRKRPDLTDGAVMAMLVPWQGLTARKYPGTMG